MSEQKPRQWNIKDGLVTGPNDNNIETIFCDGPIPAINENIRAIEFSAYRKAIEALKFECGNRCAHQNPCNARLVLRELGELNE